MIREGSHIFNEKLSFRVCKINSDRTKFAIADMNKALNAVNPSKPKILEFEELEDFIATNKLRVGSYSLPVEFSYSDEALKKFMKQTWLDKRDEKYKQIKPFIDAGQIDEYLFGENSYKNVRAFSSKSKWKEGAFINALNRYIVLGMTKNALLSWKSKNIGSNPHSPKLPEDKNIKRGVGGKDNRNSRSKTRGITELDKKRIIGLAINYKKQQISGKKSKKTIQKKLCYKKLYEAFHEAYQMGKVQREIYDKTISYFYDKEEEDCISYRQFYYHLKKHIDRDDLLKLKHGYISYEKDYKARQGSARDGVLGSTFRYEVDATVLDVYVRYPFDNKQRYSMGRPVLYLVIDVHSTLIAGFYLGFDGPNSDGVSQALVNACTDKVEFASRYNVHLKEGDWPAKHVPYEITIDNGTEYPNSLCSSILKNSLGVEAINVAAAYRGDAKGTVEGQFNVTNLAEIHFMPGAIFNEVDRTEQHPSNDAVYDYDQLVRELIYCFIEHNQCADRLKRHNFQATIDDIGISPQAIFLHSLEYEMEGGRITKTEDEGLIRWAFLREESAKVRGDCVYFRGLEYHSDYFSKAGFYQKASKNRFEIIVKGVKDWVNHIFYRTDEGEFIKLTLKNINNESPYWNQHLEPILHLQEWNKDKKAEHFKWVRKMKTYMKSIKEPEFQKLLSELQGLPENQRKSIVPNIKEHKEIQKMLNAATHAKQVLDALGFSNVQQIESPKSCENRSIEGFA